MPYLKLLKEVAYKGKTYKAGEIIEAGEDLGSRMILAGQAVSPNNKEFEEYKKAKEQGKTQSTDLEQLTKKELEQICEELGIEDYSKKKKAELIELIKAKRGE